MSWLHSLIFVVPMSVIGGAYLGGVWSFLTLFLIFVALPVSDELMGVDTRNLTKEEEQEQLSDPKYDIWVRAWTPVFVAVLAWGLWFVTTTGATPFEIVGVCLSLGVCGGFGIIVAHELMHRRPATDRALAEIMMSAVSYPHFCVEHVYGHHKKVATFEDAASSRFGESLYAFLPRTLWTSLRSFWDIETTIVKRRKIRAWSLQDRRLRYALNLVVAYTVIGLVGGWAAVAAMAAVGAVASLVLETINYLEHYGLEREQKASGRYERVQPHHSWNSSHRLSSYFMFGLARHSDHHYMASRQYPILRHHFEAPQLPCGYGTMFLVALVPPLWFAVMNPRVLRIRAGENASQAKPVQKPVAPPAPAPAPSSATVSAA